MYTTWFGRNLFTSQCDIDIIYTLFWVFEYTISFDLSAVKTTSYLQENCLHIFNIFNKPVFVEHNKTTLSAYIRAPTKVHPTWQPMPDSFILSAISRYKCHNGDNTPHCFTPSHATKIKHFSFSHDTHIDWSTYILIRKRITMGHRTFVSSSLNKWI